MKIVVAIDSLKGSLTSLEAGQAIKDGISKVLKNADIIVKPVADGGEGTVEALTLGMNGHYEDVKVTGPSGRKVTCRYGILENDNTAVIEMAGAAGITLISEEERNPLDTTTYGVGEVIKDAVKKGCRDFIIGIGGSATNDGGIGMLQALGYGILDKNKNQVPFGAKGLKEIQTITDSTVIKELNDCKFRVACDVDNILCGDNGCSEVFGPQKGADPEMIAVMDKWLERFAAISKEKFADADPERPGAGAAGGMGFAFVTYTDAVLESGVKIVLKQTKLESCIKDADIVVTGEGRLDAQTVMGKAPIGVAAIAKKYNKPVIAFSGCVTDDSGICNQHGIDAFFPVLRSAVTLKDAMDKENARKNMTATAEQVFRLIDCFYTR